MPRRPYLNGFEFCRASSKKCHLESKVNNQGDALKRISNVNNYCGRINETVSTIEDVPKRVTTTRQATTAERLQRVSFSLAVTDIKHYSKNINHQNLVPCTSTRNHPVLDTLSKFKSFNLKNLKQRLYFVTFSRRKTIQNLIVPLFAQLFAYRIDLNLKPDKNRTNRSFRVT